MRFWISFASIAALLVFGPASNAVAADMTLSYLQGICSNSDAGDRKACSFYIYGVSQAANLGKRPEGAAAWPCVPGNVPESAIEFVVKKSIGEDLMFFPDDRAMPAVSFVIGAIAKQYPCPNSK